MAKESVDITMYDKVCRGRFDEMNARIGRIEDKQDVTLAIVHEIREKLSNGFEEDVTELKAARRENRQEIADARKSVVRMILLCAGGLLTVMGAGIVGVVVLL